MMGRTSDAKARLIDGAQALLAERGYNAVGVNDFCQRAGVKKGSFYHFFDSKEALALEAIGAFGEAVGAHTAEGLGGDGTPLERIRRFARMQVAGAKGGCTDDGRVCGCPLGNLTLELSTQNEAIRQRLQSTFERWAGAFEVVVAEAMEAGEVPPGDAAGRARAMVAYMEGMLLLSKAHNDPRLGENLEADLMRLLGVDPKKK